MTLYFGFVQRNKAKILSGLLFLFVFCLLGLPFTDWWFNGDDFSGIALAFHTKTWRELLNWFLDGNIARYFYPSHSTSYAPPGVLPEHLSSCFSFYYRPLYCVYLILIHWIIGLWAYPFFLANVFFHALNTIIIFNCALWFINFIPAFLVALLFAFHPQVGFRFGSIVNLHYYIDLFLILSSLLLFKRYLETKKIFFYILSCVLFLAALFTRETAIVLPVIIFCGSYVYYAQFPDKFPASFFNNKFFAQFFVHVKHSLGYGLCALFYLGTRLWLHPIILTRSSGQTNLLSIVLATLKNTIITLKLRFYEFVTFLYDLFALSWLPWGHKVTRACLLGLCIVLLIYLFFKNKNKLITLFFAISSGLMLWPACIVNYSPRYFYEAYPFILLTFVSCYAGTAYPSRRHSVTLGATDKSTELSKTLKSRTKKILLTLFALFVGINIIFTYQNLRIREHKLFITHNAITILTKNLEPNNTRPLVFLSSLVDGFGTGLEQAVWVHYGHENFPIYYDPSTMLVQVDSNLLTNKFLHVGCADYFTKNYVTITPIFIHNSITGFRYVTSDPEKTYFYMTHNDYLSLGKKVINHKDQLGRVTDFTLVLDQKYLEKDPIFLYWDYEKQQFLLLGS